MQIVMIYNPMSQDSFAYEAERSGEWKVISISAFDHPNIKKNKNLIKGAVTVRSTLEMLGAAYALHPAFGEAQILEMSRPHLGSQRSAVGSVMADNHEQHRIVPLKRAGMSVLLSTAGQGPAKAPTPHRSI